MSITQSLVKLTGTPSYLAWTLIHDFKPNEQDVLSVRGHLLILICSPSGEADTNKAREVLQKAQADYFLPSQLSAFESLKKIAGQVVGEFVDLEHIQIAFAAQLENIIYLVVYGQARVQLLREGELITIVEGIPQKLISLSGRVGVADTLIIGTNAFFEEISPGVLLPALTQGNLALIQESLAPVVAGPKEDGSIGVVVGRFSEEDLVPVGKASPNRTLPLTKFNLRAKFVRAIDSILNRLPQKSIIVGSPQFSLTPERPRKRNAAVVGVILLGILFLSIVIGVKRREQKAVEGSYLAKLTEISHQLDEAKTLQSLNMDRARALLLNAYQSSKDLEADPLKDERLTKLASEIEASLGTIAGIYKQEALLYLDLSLVSSGYKGKTLTKSTDRMAVLDQEHKKLVGITIETKRTEVLVGPTQVSDIADASLYTDRNFILTSNGVEEISVAVRKVIDKDWSNESFVRAYTGNIYILDKEAGKIYRFSAAGRGFGSKNDWLAPDVNLDLSDTQAWVIDGSMWFLGRNNRITKLVSGRQDYVAFSYDTSAHFDDMYTDEEAQSVYFLDSSGGKIWVYNKTGKFEAEYQVPQTKEASKLIVSEELKKIILLADSKLYVVEIKHL